MNKVIKIKNQRSIDEAVDDNLIQEEILKLIYGLGAKVGLDHNFKRKN